MEKERLIKWDKRFLELAGHVSQWSKDPSTKVGAVITDKHNRLLGIGYNGFPRHCCDDEELYDNRKTKYARVVHAEANAILNATSRDLTGATIFCTLFPCSNCAGLIIQSGIKSVVSYAPEEAVAHRFAESFAVSENMLREAGIDYWIYHRE